MTKRTIAVIIAAIMMISSFIPFCAAAAGNGITIISQPQDIIADIDEAAYATVAAVGDGLQYQWQCSTNGGATYNNSSFTGCRKPTISMVIKKYMYGYLYRCVITDKSGNTATTNSLRIKQRGGIALQINSQPRNVYADIDDKATISVGAVGTGLQYQWQCSTNGGATYNNSSFTGNKKATISMTIKKYMYGYLYRCVITDENGKTVISDPAVIYPTATDHMVVIAKDHEPDYADGRQTIVSCNDFVTNADLTDTSTTIRPNLKINPDHLYMLKFTAKATKKCGKLNILINKNKINATYPVYTEKADYYLPITTLSDLTSIAISLVTEKQGVTISDFQIVDFETTDITTIKSGIYLKNSTETVLSEADSIGDPSKASIADDEYIYSVTNGSLNIYTADDQCRKVATLSDLGECHDIVLLSNKALAISSRQAGVYFVDISDPIHPTVASNYITLELATGLCSDGTYVFVCSRYAGTEIIDAANIYDPVFYARAGSGEEYYDCAVSNGILYVSLWGQQKINIFDISDLYIPKYITSVETDGNAGGIAAENDLLYVATGYHSRNTYANATKCGFGMGNGMEIYDISDPAHPKWLSTSKIDGRYKYTGNDFWKLKVSGNRVVVANTYCGAYIYDTTDPSAPKRLNHITVRIDKSSKNYKKYSTGAYIFNFNPEEYHQAAILSVCMSKGYIFIGDSVTGFYRIEQKGVDKEFVPCSVLTGSTKQPLNIGEINGYNRIITDLNANVLCAKYANGLIYAGTSKGIFVLDNNMNVIVRPAAGSAPITDLILSTDGKTMYTAEGYYGIGTYSVNGAILQKTAICKNSTAHNFCITSLAFADDSESIIIAQAGFMRKAYCTIKSGVMTMTCSTTVGKMYYRNIAMGVCDHGYSVMYDSSNLHIFAPDGSVRQMANTIANESNGMAAHGNNIVAVYSGGYLYFDPATETGKLSSLTVHRIDGINMVGKVTIRNNTMVITGSSANRLTIVDITDMEAPVLIADVTTSATPDVAEIAGENGDTIIVPLKNDGLLMLKNTGYR